MKIGFLSALTSLFIGLKLGGIIAWSWWWVLSPVLIPLGLFAVVGSFLLLAWIDAVNKVKQKGE